MLLNFLAIYVSIPFSFHFLCSVAQGNPQQQHELDDLTKNDIKLHRDDVRYAEVSVAAILIFFSKNLRICFNDCRYIRHVVSEIAMVAHCVRSMSLASPLS